MNGLTARMHKAGQTCQFWGCGLLLAGTLGWAQAEPPNPVASAESANASRYGLIQQKAYAARFASEVQALWDQRAHRGNFQGLGGVRLAYASVEAPQERAAVVIVTGRTENILKYQEVIADLVRQGYSAYVYDHRGQGFSERLLPDEPEKGHVRHFEDYVDDLQAFVTQVVNQKPHRRLFLLGHSLGGGIATRHLERYPGTFAAAALSSPMHQPNTNIGVSADSSCNWFKLTGWLFSEAWAGIAPRPYSHKAYDPGNNIYTHSAERWTKLLEVEAQYREVRLGGPTRGWADEACTASDAMIDQAGLITTPVLVLQAGKDEAVTAEGQDRFCTSLAQSGRLQCETGKPVLVPDARHELLIEADEYRLQAMSAILDFFARQP